MKKIFLLLCACFILENVPAQDSIVSGNKDSVRIVLDNTDSLLKKKPEEVWQMTNEENGKNLNSFMKEIREIDRKEKQQMYLRFGLGLLFLVVLIIGLLRRRKRKAA